MNEKEKLVHKREHPGHEIFNILVIVLVLGIATYFLFASSRKPAVTVDTYEECVAAGYMVLETYPEQCVTPDGRSFTRKITEFETILKSDGANIAGAEFSNTVIRTGAAWQNFWNSINLGLNPKPALPEVDFTSEFVVAVFSGNKNTGGYSIEIGSIETLPGAYKVKGIETQPGAGCVTTQVLTNPYHIVRFKPLAFDASREFEFMLGRTESRC